MEHLSAHGLLFVAVQIVVLGGLAGLVLRHHRRRGEAGPGAARHAVPWLVIAGFVVWYAVLRVQPARRGADPFGYTLGVFDGVSLVGALGLVLLHILISYGRRGDAPSAGGKTL